MEWAPLLYTKERRVRRGVSDLQSGQLQHRPLEVYRGLPHQNGLYSEGVTGMVLNGKQGAKEETWK